MKKKYLLSTGKTTELVEYYIIDLFKLHLSIYPKDIPGADHIGFNFIITNTKKDEIKSDISGRLDELINKFRKRFTGIDIQISESALINDSTVKLIIAVNEISETVLVDI